MADKTQLNLLRQGVAAWNRWRQENRGTNVDLREAGLSRTNLERADLSGANLFRADLGQANLREANLSGAVLRWADLAGADLRTANLFQVNLSGADLSGANLHGALLSEADLRGAILQEAYLAGAVLSEADLRGAALDRTDLRQAVLIEANLHGADLSEADLSGAYLSGASLGRARTGYTIFSGVDLSEVRGLETIEHAGPSTLGLDTLYRAGGQLPVAFLRGAGVPDPLIDYLYSLAPVAPYEACFISYAPPDEALAWRLLADLQRHGLRCWATPGKISIAAKIRSHLNGSARLHEKLVLLLSTHSLTSAWLEQEIETILAIERKQKKMILFPIRLDPTILEAEQPWAAEIQHSRAITDFSAWQDQQVYQAALDRLLAELTGSPAGVP